MKKMIFTALLTLSVSAVGFAAPVTDFSMDKSSVDGSCAALDGKADINVSQVGMKYFDTHRL